jgi:hypothetical protein
MLWKVPFEGHIVNVADIIEFYDIMLYIEAYYVFKLNFEVASCNLFSSIFLWQLSFIPITLKLLFLDHLRFFRNE